MLAYCLFNFGICLASMCQAALTVGGERSKNSLP